MNYLRSVVKFWFLTLLLLNPAAQVRADNQPPYDNKDPAIAENFRNVYLGVDNLNLLTQLLGYTLSSTANLLCIDSPTFCVNAVTHQVNLSTGTAAAPSITLGEGTSVGLYRSNTAEIGLSFNGTTRCRFSSSSATFATNIYPDDTASLRDIGGIASYWQNIYMGNGTANLPSYTFGNDSGTGFYRAAVNLVGLSQNGALKWTFGSELSSQNSATIIRSAAGSNSAPSYTFAGDEDTGIYGDLLNSIRFTVGGVQQCSITSLVFGAVASGFQIESGAGTQAAPGLTFAGDPDTGFYDTAANTMNAAAGGLPVSSFTAAGVALLGTNTSDNAATGWIGEYVSSASVVTQNATNNVFVNYESISLTAGDWEIVSMVRLNNNSATTTTMQTAISINSGNTTTDHVAASNLAIDSRAFGAADDVNSVIPSYRLSISATTTVFLKFRCNFSAGTPQVLAGRISARRKR